MDGTILSQGRFVVPTGVPAQYLNIPSNVDWMKVYNYTNAAKVGAATGLGWEYYWQRGMAVDTAMVKFYANGTAVMMGDTLVSGGFTLYDPSGQSASALPLLGNAVATTASSSATSPVISTGTTTGLIANTATARGSIVRLSAAAGYAAANTLGVDFAIGTVVASTSFTLTVAAVNPFPVAPLVAATAAAYRVVNYDPLYYPRDRWVINVTAVANAAVTTTVQHGLTPGQVVRFNIPAASGMTQLNGLTATVLSVTNDFTFVTDIDASTFTTFAWPTTASLPSSFPTLSPVGENTAISLSSIGNQVPMIGGVQINGTQSGILAGSMVNTGFLGMKLGTGGVGTVAGALAISGPAGTTAADVVYWVAGKSSFGGL
jgi:hypothetical protein